MSNETPTTKAPGKGLWASLAAAATAFLASCSSVVLNSPMPSSQPSQASAHPTPGSTSPPVPVPPQSAAARPRSSNADNPRAYRKDAAAHLYNVNAERIFKGKLPAMLYAVGVLQVDIDGQGRVTNLKWMRAPKHAPEVVAEIERTVRQAAPYPAPARMGRVTYTDTWLWDEGGSFQLDTLTEGQM